MELLNRLKKYIHLYFSASKTQVSRLFILLIVVITFGKTAFYLFITLFLIEALFSYGSILGVLLVSGIIKIAPSISALPLDITFVFYTLFLTYSFGFIFREKGQLKFKDYKTKYFVILLCAFAVLAIIPILHSPIEPLHNDRMKVLLGFYIPVSIVILLSKVIVASPHCLQKFTSTVLNIGIIWVGLGLHNYLFKTGSNYFHTISAFGEDYMKFSSLLIPIVIYLLISLFKQSKSILLTGLLGIILLFTVILSPARSLTIATLAVSTLLIILYLSSDFNFGKVLKIVGIICGVGLIIFAIYSNQIRDDSNLLARGLARLLNYQVQGSIQERILILENAFTDWRNNSYSFLGASYIEFKNGPGLYVHSIILELIFEYGIFGLPFLAYYLGAVYLFVTKLIFKFKFLSKEIVWLLSICLIFFIFSSVSNTLGELKIDFILFALAIRILLSSNDRQTTQAKPSL